MRQSKFIGDHIIICYELCGGRMYTRCVRIFKYILGVHPRSRTVIDFYARTSPRKSDR